MNTSSLSSGLRCGLIATLLGALSGCATSGDHVIAATGTVIGLEVAQGATGSPAFKLGYDRAELAYVPTNRAGAADGTRAGADETAEVLMELRYSGIGSTSGESGIYQRLAVGKIAVAQAGASVMFAKAADGKLDDKAVAAIAAANKNVLALPTLPPDVASEQARLRNQYTAADAATQARYNQAAAAAGYPTGGPAAFLLFTADLAATKEKIDDVKRELRALGINPDAP